MSAGLVIGIGGATCGGKSTLAKLLCQLWGPALARHFNQDDYYFPDEHPGHTFLPELNHINWELESAFDNAKLAKEVQNSTFSDSSRPLFSSSCFSSLVQQLECQAAESFLQQGEQLSSSCRQLVEGTLLPPITVLEGIQVLNSPRLSQLCDLKVFVTLDHQTCAQRRQLRSYDPPDPPGYFEAVVWPSYTVQLTQLKQSSDSIEFLDGAKPLSENFVTLLKLVLSLNKQ